MAIAHLGTDTSSQIEEDTVLTYSWTLPSGSDRSICVGVSSNAATVSSVTYDGNSLTSSGAQAVNGSSRAQTWYLAIDDLGTPPTDAAHDVVVTVSTSDFIESGCSGFSGVDNTSSTAMNEANNSNTGNGPNAAVSITSVSDNAFMYACGAQSEGSPGSVGSGESLGYMIDNNSEIGFGSYTTAAITPAGANSMNWTGLGSGKGYAMQGMAIKPAVAAGGLSIPVAMNSYRQWRQ